MSTHTGTHLGHDFVIEEVEVERDDHVDLDHDHRLVVHVFGEEWTLKKTSWGSDVKTYYSHPLNPYQPTADPVDAAEQLIERRAGNDTPEQ